MKPQTIIFHGPSGAGKGTQAKLLREYLEKSDPENRVLYISTGHLFRKLAEKSTYAGRAVKAILDQGGLPPEFLPIWMWSECLSDGIQTGNEHVIFDGAVRRVSEAPMLNSALDFFKRIDPAVIVLNVSPQRATVHLKERGRYDDNDEDIKARLLWYEQNVVPAIGYFRAEPRYRVVDINGEQGIEEVQRDIRKKLGI